MNKIYFKVSARAGKLLGRENFSNPENAVIELVKNSYDADAHNCFVIFDIKKKGSAIYIIDNGEGMTDEVIEKQWMTIGTGNKEENYISNEKRVKTGAKGIGRFALDRLGFNSELWTKTNNPDGISSHFWKMNWKQFDNTKKSISEISADIVEEDFNLIDIIKKQFPENRILINRISKTNFNHGTIIKITNPKDVWDVEEISDLFKNLEALIPPKELKIPFEVTVLNLMTPKEFGVIETAFFNDYDYKVEAKYNIKNLTIDFNITRNEFDIQKIEASYKGLHKGKKIPLDLRTIKRKSFKITKKVSEVLNWNLNRKNKKLLVEVGDFNFSFYYLKLSNQIKRGYEYPYKDINIAERKKVLERFGGVKIYRDSFRVRPYGNPDNDWLGLGKRKVTSPAGAGQRIGDWRVTPGSTAGIISISRKKNPSLIDKADRDGLFENDSYDVFKNIIKGIIREFEVDRSKVLHIYFNHFKEEEGRKQEEEIQKRAEELAEKIISKRKASEEKYYGKKKTNRDFITEKNEEEEKKSYKEEFKKSFEEFSKPNNDKYEELVQVRALASLGLIVSSFAHELKEIKNNASEIESLESILKAITPKELLNSQLYLDGTDIIELLKNDAERIKYWIDYSLSSVKKDKRKRRQLNFVKYNSKLIKQWENILLFRNIRVEIKNKITPNDYRFRAFEMDFDTIFSNLINNSIDSFKNLNKIRERKIIIKQRLLKDSIEIVYSDNGNGLASIFNKNKENIFIPFVTSKKDRKGNDIGTGLGMYLVKNVVEDNNGTLEILSPKIGFSLKMVFQQRK